MMPRASGLRPCCSAAWSGSRALPRRTWRVPRPAPGATTASPAPLSPGAPRRSASTAWPVPRPAPAMGLDRAPSEAPPHGPPAFPCYPQHSQRHGALPRGMFAGTSHALVAACAAPAVLAPPPRACYPYAGPQCPSLRPPRSPRGAGPAPADGWCFRSRGASRGTAPGRPGPAGGPRPLPAADRFGAGRWGAAALPQPGVGGLRRGRGLMGPAVARACHGRGHGRGRHSPVARAVLPGAATPTRIGRPLRRPGAVRKREPGGHGGPPQRPPRRVWPMPHGFCWPGWPLSCPMRCARPPSPIPPSPQPHPLPGSSFWAPWRRRANSPRSGCAGPCRPRALSQRCGAGCRRCPRPSQGLPGIPPQVSASPVDSRGASCSRSRPAHRPSPSAREPRLPWPPPPARP
jgi:hypothetical protein